jgi:hypothetical protein
MPNPFEKNDPRINRKGRERGKPNKTTEQLRTMLHNFISDNIETLQNDFEKLKPAERLSFIERLLKHVLPAPLTDISQLSETDIDFLIEKLKNKGHDEKN